MSLSVAELSSPAALRAYGGRGAKGEPAQDGGVQAGEGSSRTSSWCFYSWMPAKQVSFFSKEALPGETPADLGRKRKRGLKLLEQNLG